MMGEGEQANLLGKLESCVQTKRGAWSGVERHSNVQLCPPS